MTEKVDNNNKINFGNESNNFDKGTKTLEKKAREKVLNSLKSTLFLIQDLDTIPTPESATEPEVVKELMKPAKAKTQRKISSLKLQEEFLNKINYENKNIIEQIFKEFF